ncbi:MAG: 4-(cytidine 5'-diphospho)-2-C-methyl-D-erythritol kinase [Elusimicrobia bacterium]|nr:4-(cytidine 5'-diphospho)-2-C-methyl-D-erythritol kinase [Elusimicrobiota bacterium]
MKVQCPAKINLFLEVTGKRSDGYHRLATLFAKINLYDVLDLSIGPRPGIELTVEGDRNVTGGAVSAGPENLVWRAAQAFLRAFRVGRGVKIHLVKRIPVGAGLGGGSSDAAGTLLGLAKLFEIKLDARKKARLRALGARLGADVPFFLHPAPFCLGTGIGDRLKPIRVAGPLPYMVLVYPEVGISTAESYKALPKPSRCDVLTRLSHLDKLIGSLKRERPLQDWESLLFNRLEQAAVPALSHVERARRILSRLGARGVRMSGSGSSVFGFVSSHEEGARLLKRLQGYPWKVFLTCCNG